MVSTPTNRLKLTEDEIQVLTRSPEALGVLINHYEHQEQLTRSDVSGGSTKAALSKRRELIESILDEAAPELEARDLPPHLKSVEEHDEFDRAQGRLSLSDPSQAVGNLRWMLYQVWWRWKSLDLSVRSLRSGPWTNVASTQARAHPSERAQDASGILQQILDFDRQLTLAGETPTGADYDTILKWAKTVSDPAIREEVLNHDACMKRTGLKPTGDDYQAIFSIVMGLASGLNEGVMPTGP